jgi:hypothetical protein
MFARFTQFAVAALILTGGAQSHAAPLVYGTYYEEYQSIICSTFTSCTLFFSQTPSDRLLMLSKIDCHVQSSTPITSNFLRISANSGGQPLPTRFLPLPLTPPIFTNNAYFMDFYRDTHFLIGQGRFPYIVVSVVSTGSQILDCTIVGDLVTPIQ